MSFSPRTTVGPTYSLRTPGVACVEAIGVHTSKCKIGNLI